MHISTIIDGDGHIFEDAAAISGLLPSPYRELGPLPQSKLLPPRGAAERSPRQAGSHSVGAISKAILLDFLAQGQGKNLKAIPSLELDYVNTSRSTRRRTSTRSWRRKSLPPACSTD